MASLKTDTLNYGDDVKRIYAGDFEHVTLKPDSTEFGLMVGGYMNEYSEGCDRYLPKDKAEITGVRHRRGDPERLQPVRMAMAASSTSLAKGQDYKRLMDDLTTAESRAWMMNRYVPVS